MLQDPGLTPPQSKRKQESEQAQQQPMRLHHLGEVMSLALNDQFILDSSTTTTTTTTTGPAFLLPSRSSSPPQASMQCNGGKLRYGFISPLANLVALAVGTTYLPFVAIGFCILNS